MKEKNKKRKMTGRINEVLAEKYGEPKRRKVRPPLDQLIQSVIWRYTGIKSGIRAFRKLNRTFVDWNEMRVSSITEISAAISNAAWAHDCAEHLRQILENLFRLRNVVNMDFLQDFSQSEAATFLRSLQGMTRDLADEVLLFNYGYGRFPLTEHGTRMCFRMGLIDKQSPTLKNQRALLDMWDPQYHIGFALFLHDHGADICREERPRCTKCPVEKVCPKIGLDQ